MSVGLSRPSGRRRLYKGDCTSAAVTNIGHLPGLRFPSLHFGHLIGCFSALSRLMMVCFLVSLRYWAPPCHTGPSGTQLPVWWSCYLPKHLDLIHHPGLIRKSCQVGLSRRIATRWPF